VVLVDIGYDHDPVADSYMETKDYMLFIFVSSTPHSVVLGFNTCSLSV
jgi:hypothetical protein